MMQEYWITEYGAVADGVTNCAAAIQAAAGKNEPYLEAGSWCRRGGFSAAA
mgnify:CR=1 FL=1